jgi:hypothetical protein
MKDVFARLASDLFSAIVFLVIYLVTDTGDELNRSGPGRYETKVGRKKLRSYDPLAP